MEMLHLDHDVARAALGPKGRRMALLGADHVLRIWDVKASRQLDYPIMLEEAVSQVAFSPDGETVVTIGRKQGTQVWHVPTGERLSSLTGSPVTLAHFSPDSRLVVGTLDPGGARIWDTAGRPLTPPLRHGGLLAAASFRADGKQVITVSRRGTVAVWEIPSLDRTTPI
jgi:WD40 repeat protein